MLHNNCTQPEFTDDTLPSGMILAEGYNMDRLTEMYNNAKKNEPTMPGSLNEIENANKVLETVAIKFMGMGHILRVYFDHLLCQFVIFHECGSNGYEHICHDDVRQEYFDCKTLASRRAYMQYRINNGYRSTLADNIFNYIISPLSNDDDGPPELWGDCVINYTCLDSKYSLDSNRLNALFSVYDLEQDSPNSSELLAAKSQLAEIEKNLKIQKAKDMAKQN